MTKSQVLETCFWEERKDRGKECKALCVCVCVCVCVRVCVYVCVNQSEKVIKERMTSFKVDRNV